MQRKNIAGKWTYRSYRNDPALVGDDAQKALGLIFAEAIFTFDLVDGTALTGTIDWDGGGLDLKGIVIQAAGSTPLTMEIIGTGRPGTGTAGWEYDYYAYLAHEWPNGIGQVPAIVGTVIRAKPHGSAPAGYVASFIAVKQS